MKIIGLEEHVALPNILEAWSALPNFPQIAEMGFGDSPMARRLRDTGDARLADMDAQGIDIQVLSVSTPGVTVLKPAEAVSVAWEANNALAEIVARRPDRFQAFATLPTQASDDAATELERAVTQLGLKGAMVFGRAGETAADSTHFDRLYATAERLNAPLYFHPQTPPAPVLKAYYSGLDPKIDFAFGTFGLGWYYDLGVQMLRMVMAGVFDRHPGLQVILGHWGEVVLFYLDHIGTMDEDLRLERPIADYFRSNFWITGSGTTSERYQRWAAEVVGPERLMYATDYPFTFDTGYDFLETARGRGRAFLEQAPFLPEQKAAIGSGTWERLTGHIRGTASRP